MNELACQIHMSQKARKTMSVRKHLGCTVLKIVRSKAAAFNISDSRDIVYAVLFHLLLDH